jgi:SAM-dependent methyltransferase
MTATTGTPADTSTDTFAARVFDASLAFADILTIGIGDQLGWYDALAAHGPMTAGDLATSTGTDARYAREWLEQQTTTGIVQVEDASRPTAERRYLLPPGHAEVLTDRDSLAYLAPLARLFASAGEQFGALLEAYRGGGGVSWSQYGTRMRTGQAEMNRPFFLSELGTTWIPAVPDLHARLLRGGRVADVGCGEGWSAIGLALAYPDVHVDGYDVDAPSVAAARRHAEEAGVADRVRFHCVDIATVDTGGYDLVAAFECIHDLPHPVDALDGMRRLAADDGHVIVMDERVGERFTGERDDVERLMYGFSVLVCLPDGRSHSPSAATGTVMRPDTLRDYARQAGFADIEFLPIDNDLWRFYRLVRTN